MRAASTVSSTIPEVRSLQERRWREMHALATRGMFQPETLSATEISVISGVALLGINEVSAEANGPPSAQEKR